MMESFVILAVGVIVAGVILATGKTAVAPATVAPDLAPETVAASAESPTPDTAPPPEGVLAEMWGLYKQVCAQDLRIRPETLMAIFQHESAMGTSRLFLEANNPAGIKYYPQYPSLEHVSGSYTSSDGIGYARFLTRERGAHAHRAFLLQERYSNAWLLVAEEAIPLIAQDGYAEDPNWSAGVLAQVRKVNTYA